MSGNFSATLNHWAEVSIQRTMYEFGHFLRARGVSMPQIMVLMYLHHTGPHTISDIGKHLEISTPAASQLIQRLVEDETLQRRESREDRRVKEISLTPKGIDLIHAAIAARRTWIAELAQQLPVDQQPDIEAALLLLIQAAQNSGFTHTPKEVSS